MSASSLVREPIYHQLHDLLRALVTGGEFKAEAQFLTERQVSERFGVSRVTANKALSQLVVTGVLEFRKGIGTFVRGGALQNDLRSLVSFTSKAGNSGKVPTTRVLRFSKQRVGGLEPSIAEALKLGPKDEVFVMVRLRLADGEPVILERRHVVASLCAGLTREIATGSLYEAFEKKFRLKLTGAEQTVRAIDLSSDDARLLKTDPGKAALWVHAVGFASNEPLWLEDTLYRGDRYEFHNVLGASGTPRGGMTALVDSATSNLAFHP
jgi:GntR family transcriptional regulator